MRVRLAKVRACEITHERCACANTMHCGNFLSFNQLSGTWYMMEVDKFVCCLLHHALPSSVSLRRRLTKGDDGIGDLLVVCVPFCWVFSLSLSRIPFVRVDVFVDVFPCPCGGGNSPPGCQRVCVWWIPMGASSSFVYLLRSGCDWPSPCWWCATLWREDGCSALRCSSCWAWLCRILFVLRCASKVSSFQVPVTVMWGSVRVL